MFILQTGNELIYPYWFNRSEFNEENNSDSELTSSLLKGSLGDTILRSYQIENFELEFDLAKLEEVQEIESDSYPLYLNSPIPLITEAEANKEGESEFIETCSILTDGKISKQASNQKMRGRKRIRAKIEPIPTSNFEHILKKRRFQKRIKQSLKLEDSLQSHIDMKKALDFSIAALYDIDELAPSLGSLLKRRGLVNTTNYLRSFTYQTKLKNLL